MSLQSRRKSKRHELDSSKQFAVKIHRTEHVKDVTSDGVQDAKIVDISLHGFKLESKIAFEFQEKVVVELPRRGGASSILVSAEVRWIQPESNGKSWSAGCLIAEDFPPDFINEISQDGILDRRNSVRKKINQNATGRWEMSQQDLPVCLLDVSSHGVGIVVPQAEDIGKRIRIKLPGSDKSIMAKTVWQKEIDDGFQYGCEVLEGSPYSIIENAIEEAGDESEGFAERYQTLTFCGLSFVLALLIRDIFF